VEEDTARCQTLQARGARPTPTSSLGRNSRASSVDMTSEGSSTVSRASPSNSFGRAPGESSLPRGWRVSRAPSSGPAPSMLSPGGPVWSVSSRVRASGYRTQGILQTRLRPRALGPGFSQPLGLAAKRRRPPMAYGGAGGDLTDLSPLRGCGRPQPLAQVDSILDGPVTNWAPFRPQRRPMPRLGPENLLQGTASPLPPVRLKLIDLMIPGHAGAHGPCLTG